MWRSSSSTESGEPANKRTSYSSLVVKARLGTARYVVLCTHGDARSRKQGFEGAGAEIDEDIAARSVTIAMRNQTILSVSTILLWSTGFV